MNVEDDYGDDAIIGKGKGMSDDTMNPTQFAQPPLIEEKWVVKLTLNLTRLRVVSGQASQVGAIAQEELGEGTTPGEAYRTALARLKPIIRAYKLEQGPIPLD